MLKQLALIRIMNKDLINSYLSFSWHLFVYFSFSGYPELGASCVGTLFSLSTSPFYLSSRKNFPQNVLCGSGQKWAKQRNWWLLPVSPQPLQGEGFLFLERSLWHCDF